MAPTEILARQHFATIEPLAEAAGVHGRAADRPRQGRDARKPSLRGLASARSQLVVGTHALVQEDVAFADLALAVIDEQHRFGVHQRLALAAKGRAADLLVMTATPIPRTLMLTAYGDLDVSKLIEKPAGRQPIDTRTLPLERLDEVVAGAAPRRCRAAPASTGSARWSRSPRRSTSPPRSERYAHLAAALPGKVGLVHGRLKGAGARTSDGRLRRRPLADPGGDDRDRGRRRRAGRDRHGDRACRALRPGAAAPAARPGRARTATSTCLLLYQAPLGETAKARLNILRETEDGFRIAEEDLRLRGAGELLGTRQSGLPEFRLADLAVHGELLAAARDDARLIVERDPDLASRAGRGAARRCSICSSRMPPCAQHAAG